MTALSQPNLEKIKQLIANATSPREKAIYQALLEKAIAGFELSQPEESQQEDTDFIEPSPTESTPSAAAQTAIFQAIGVIRGEVNIISKRKITITIGNKKYPLFSSPLRPRTFRALKNEIKATGNRLQRLIVYPKVGYFPNSDQPRLIAFQVTTFDRGRSTMGNFFELNDLEFKLRGLWKFIPVCQTPCVSVMRNFTKDNLKSIKQADPEKRVKFLKAKHFPLLWENSPVDPFKFNSNAEFNQQEKPAFVQVKAKFLPEQDLFEFIEQLAEPMETPPKFLKVFKKKSDRN